MLPSRNRLRNEEDILKVLKKGRICSSLYFRLRFLCLENMETTRGVEGSNNTKNEGCLKGWVVRVAFLAPKKEFRQAVERNVVKRTAREAVRELLPSFLVSCDIVITLSRRMLGVKSSDVFRDMQHILKKARLITQQEEVSK